MTKKIIEHNASTNEIVEREMTPEELQEFQDTYKPFVEAALIKAEEREAKKQATESAKAKLASLGLDESEVNAILGL